MSPIDYLVIILVIFTSVGLLIAGNWRWGVGLLAIQYLGVFILVNNYWSVELSTVKLVAGWMTSSILAVSQLTVKEPEGLELQILSNRLFRVFVAIPLIITANSIAVLLKDIVPSISFIELFGGLILIFLGLLKIGLTSRPLRGMFGLLTLLSGFEVIYAAVESSDLVAGLLAVITLSLGLCGAYLLAAPEMREEAT
ncbi:MAG: hypothetical protein JXA19_06435 [Anaerolineales bacterium]|nr:hypothetical protein [Anaerolineales bacterium]